MAKQRKKGTVIFTSILAVVIVALIIVTVCIFVFGKDEGAYAHTHEYSDTYLYNDDYHWRPATCGHDDLVTDKDTHSYDYDSTVAPTCREQGYDIYKCVCGRTENRNFVEAVDHVYENGFCKFCGEKEPSKELVLELDESGAFYIVTEVNEVEDTAVIIPSVYGEGDEEKPVTQIAEKAFENSNVTSVKIPKSVTKIGNLAFTGCTALEKVILPKELTSIGWSLFVGCDALTEIEYTGTKAEWEALVYNTAWNGDLKVTCTVKCTDETLTYTYVPLETPDTPLPPENPDQDENN